MKMAMPGQNMKCGCVVDDGVGQHPAPARGGRADTNAEEGQRRLEKDVGGDQQRRVDQDRRNEVRQHLCAEDVAAAGPNASGRLDELPLSKRERLAPDDPPYIRPAEESDDEDQQRDPQLVALKAERLVRKTPARAMAKTSSGKARKTSISRLMKVSTQPPMKPEMMPRVVPMATDSMVARKAINRISGCRTRSD